jgi:hypothetical protein
MNSFSCDASGNEVDIPKIDKIPKAGLLFNRLF